MIRDTGSTKIPNILANEIFPSLVALWKQVNNGVTSVEELVVNLLKDQEIRGLFQQAGPNQLKRLLVRLNTKIEDYTEQLAAIFKHFVSDIRQELNKEHDDIDRKNGNTSFSLKLKQKVLDLVTQSMV